MQYHVKRPGSFLWDTLTTDSLVSELERGRLGGDWKIRRDGEAEDYTVDELCREEAALTAHVPGAGSQALGPRAGDSAPEEREPRYTALLGLAVYLVLVFLWRVFTTAHEYDSEGMVFFSIGLDILCLVGLVAARMQIKRARPGQPLSGGAQMMFVVALVAGVGLLAIRLNSNASWWTGHLHYDCCPPR